MHRWKITQVQVLDFKESSRNLDLLAVILARIVRACLCKIFGSITQQCNFSIHIAAYINRGNHIRYPRKSKYQK